MTPRRRAPPEALDAIVVGAGMAGATAALALANGGLGVVLIDPLPFEAQLAPAFDGRASAISAAAFAQWRVLGVAARLQAHAQPIRQILVTGGRPPGPSAAPPSPALLRFHEGEPAAAGAGEPLGYMIENRRIRAALAEAVAASSIRLEAPARVEGCEAAPCAATVILADGRRLAAPLVVAADGRNSGLRRQAGIGVNGWDYGQAGLVATVRLGAPHQGVAYEHFLPAGPFAILPLTGDRASLVWAERAQAAPAVLAAGDDLFAALLARRFGPFLGDLAVEGPRFAYPLSLQVAQSLVAPRLALLGDAAHAIHPIAGQGLNMGLKDAAALAEVVIDAARLGEDIGAAATLARYARWRRLDNLAVTLATDAFNRLYANDLAPLRLARGLAMRAVHRFAPARRLFLGEAAGAAGDLPRLLRGEAV